MALNNKCSREKSPLFSSALVVSTETHAREAGEGAGKLASRRGPRVHIKQRNEGLLQGGLAFGQTGTKRSLGVSGFQKAASKIPTDHGLSALDRQQSPASWAALFPAFTAHPSGGCHLAPNNSLSRHEGFQESGARDLLSGSKTPDGERPQPMAIHLPTFQGSDPTTINRGY